MPMIRTSDQFQGPIAPNYGKCSSCGTKLEHRTISVTENVALPYMFCKTCRRDTDSEILTFVCDSSADFNSCSNYEELVSNTIKERQYNVDNKNI